jgi:hypothetical protein
MNMQNIIPEFTPIYINNRGNTLAQSKLLSSDPFNYSNFIYKNYLMKLRGLSGGDASKKFKNLTVEFLNRYFGPTGPGYNYGGATSDFYEYTNLNDIPEVSFSEIFYHRSLYHNNVTFSGGVTLGDMKNNFFIKTINNINEQKKQAAQTPGIAGIIGTTPSGSLGDRIK